MAVVRERVNLARKIDVAELHARRQNADIGWLKKSAKEMDILIDDNSDYSDSENFFNGSDDEGANQIKARRNLKHMKNTLKHLIEKPIFPKGFSYKYPEINSKEKNQKAVNALKNSIVENAKLRKIAT